MKKNNLLLIGTHNDGKFREISKLISGKTKKISPKSLNIKAPKETGKTFKSNSELKANFFYKKSKLVSLSDDSGLEILALKKKRLSGLSWYVSSLLLNERIDGKTPNRDGSLPATRGDGRLTSELLDAFVGRLDRAGGFAAASTHGLVQVAETGF